jgi:hypothetical protein
VKTPADLKAWADDLKSKASPRQVDFATHRPTDGELNNYIYLSLGYVLAWKMRHADFQVIMKLGGRPETVDQMGPLTKAMGEYAWDHLMGEPDEFQPKDLEYAFEAMLEFMYGLDEKSRNHMGAV